MSWICRGMLQRRRHFHQIRGISWVAFHNKWLSNKRETEEQRRSCVVSTRMVFQLLTTADGSIRFLPWGKFLIVFACRAWSKRDWDQWDDPRPAIYDEPGKWISDKVCVNDQRKTLLCSTERFITSRTRASNRNSLLLGPISGRSK